MSNQEAYLDTNLAGVEVPWDEAFATVPYTVEVRARATGKDPIGTLVGFAPPAIKQPWRLLVTDKGELLVELAHCQPSQVFGGVKITDREWHQFAFSFDGKIIRMFIDGKLVKEVPATYKPQPLVHGPLVIGTCLHPGSEQVGQAHIAEVRLSNIARNSFGKMDRDEHTIGLWELPSAEDHSGHNRNGTLQTSPADLSLDDVDARSFRAGPSPIDQPGTPVKLEEGAWPEIRGSHQLLLDGRWQLAEGGSESTRLAGEWADAIPAGVPVSVHLALQIAGLIPDPKHGMNELIAREMSFRTWWYRRTFPRPAGDGHRLVFDGVAVKCTVWLNGEKLGSHEGMFGGPTFDIAGKLKDQNELVVRIEPQQRGVNGLWDSNETWRNTVAFNSAYGWHHADTPPLGIWRSARVEAALTARIQNPFIATIDPHAGKVELRVDVNGRGKLSGTIEPENFTGSPLRFSVDVTATPARLQLTIPNPMPWWPNGIGDPSLYRLRLNFQPAGNGIADTSVTTFGLRTIEMRPMPDGRHPKRYNWTFVINGRPLFIKGTGWCTMDASMDFRRERYERFLRAAQEQNCQMVRASGSGMPETDDFYDLCDHLGIMVMQEWPTAWNSHDAQPYDVLEETVRLNTLRLRNRPSLVMWGAGHESSSPHGQAIDMMGRLAVELDGTRPFHRAQPWGGSDQNYDCWWGNAPLDHNLNMTARFWGEFGVPSLPVIESVQRYLPIDEKTLWPPRSFGSFAYHTPVFNRAGDLDLLKQYSGYFTAGETMQRFVQGSQLAQVVGVRHTLERARTLWPKCTGALMCKLNDNQPAAGWSTIDWYGATKMAHWFVRDAFSPLHACVLFESVNIQGRAIVLPVFLLDDADSLAEARWEVRVRAYAGNLQVIKEQRFKGGGSIDRVRRLGELALTAEQTKTAPLFVVVKTYRDNKHVAGTFYFVNYEAKKDSLFELPRTTVSHRVLGRRVILRNTGQVPAVAVNVFDVANLDTFTADDNYIWLDPGELREITVNSDKQLRVEAWNVG